MGHFSDKFRKNKWGNYVFNPIVISGIIDGIKNRTLDINNIDKMETKDYIDTILTLKILLANYSWDELENTLGLYPDFMEWVWKL